MSNLHATLSEAFIICLTIKLVETMIIIGRSIINVWYEIKILYILFSFPYDTHMRVKTIAIFPMMKKEKLH